MGCADKCAVETNISTFQVGYPAKDTAGNAIEGPDGIQLEAQYPGTNEFVVVGSCDFPNDKIKWKHGPDGQYIMQTRAYTYTVKGKGCGVGSCKKFGPVSTPIAVYVKDARPTAPPAPIELTDCGC